MDILDPGSLGQPGYQYTLTTISRLQSDFLVLQGIESNSSTGCSANINMKSGWPDDERPGDAW